MRESAKENPSLFFEANKPPIIVDEIQKAAELFDYIKDIVDEDKTKGQFYLTGSQSIKLMKNISDSLAGRAGIVKLQGLSIRELVRSPYRKPFLPVAERIEHAEKANSGLDYTELLSYIHKGFFPELHETKSELYEWADFYSSYFQTYIEKDIRDILNIQDESAFIKFVRSAASLTGEMLNVANMASICGKDVKTVKSWLSALESSGLVYLLEPYYNNFNKRMIKAPKLYFLDTGFACWLLGWNTPEQLVNGAMWGHIFESFVFAEVLKSYYNDGIVKPPLYYYRDKDKNEIDLVIEESDTLYPVKIKTTSDPTKSMVNAFRMLDAIPGKKTGTGGRSMLVKILKGSKDKKVLEHGLENCPAYGFYRSLTMDEISHRVDWVILQDYLDIDYNYRLPVLVFSEKGWAIEQETFADELYQRFCLDLKEKQARIIFEMKDVNHQVVLGVLEKIQGSKNAEFIPFLEAWRELEVRKVRERINSVIKTLTSKAPTISYKKAVPTDAGAIAGLVCQTIKEIYPKYYPREIVDFFCMLHSKERIAKDIKDGTVWILKSDDQFIGTGCVEDNHITRVYVLPQFQGHGHGRYIVQKLGYQSVKHEQLSVANGVILVYDVMVKKLI